MQILLLNQIKYLLHPFHPFDASLFSHFTIVSLNVRERETYNIQFVQSSACSPFAVFDALFKVKDDSCFGVFLEDTLFLKIQLLSISEYSLFWPVSDVRFSLHALSSS